jgi:S1-C subfamily serine protease
VDAMVVTAHIVEGMSGGPVFNKTGEVVGIANGSVVIEKEDGTEARFSLAIPISELPNLP